MAADTSGRSHRRYDAGRSLVVRQSLIGIIIAGRETATLEPEVAAEGQPMSKGDFASGWAGEFRGEGIGLSLRLARAA
jgi:hypothetical protein